MRVFRALISKEDPVSVAVLLAGRRFGKTSLLRDTAVYKVLTFDPSTLKPGQQRPIVSIIAPTLAQCKELYWDSLVRIFATFPGLVKGVPDKANAIIRFNFGLPDLILKGADGGRIRGQGYWFVGLDEYQLFLPGLWDNDLYPGLADTPGSQALVIGTPIGKQNHFYAFTQKARQEPDWRFYHFTSLDNPKPAVQEFIKKCRGTYPPRSFRQEFLASFEEFEGQIFTELNDQHLIDVPKEFSTTWLGVDPGETNPALSVIGLVGDSYYVVDSWKNPNPGSPVVIDELINQAARLCRLHNIYKTFVPDDRPTLPIAFRRAGERLNIEGLKRSVKLARSKPGVLERIELVNSLFFQNRLYINRSLESIIDEFKSYRRALDKSGNVLPHPAEGQIDHQYESAAYVIAAIETRNNLQAA